MFFLLLVVMQEMHDLWKAYNEQFEQLSTCQQEVKVLLLNLYSYSQLDYRSSAFICHFYYYVLGATQVATEKKRSNNKRKLTALTNESNKVSKL